MQTIEEKEVPGSTMLGLLLKLTFVTENLIADKGSFFPSMQLVLRIMRRNREAK